MREATVNGTLGEPYPHSLLKEGVGTRELVEQGHGWLLCMRCRERARVVAMWCITIYREPRLPWRVQLPFLPLAW